MRLALVLVFCACDFQPPPKKAPPAPPPVAVAPIDVAVPSTPPPVMPGSAAPAGSGGSAMAGSGSGIVRPEPSAECVEIAARIVAMMIDATPDSQKASLEAERAKTVRRAAMGCTLDKWTPQTIDCVRKAPDIATIGKCTADVKAPDPID